MSAPQVVKINDVVYVGGGIRKPGDNHTVFKYSLKSETWVPLPTCPTYQHGLASWNNRLVAIGGKIEDLVTNRVFVFENTTLWTENLPPMNTPRYYLSTANFRNEAIIAAGGTLGVGIKTGRLQRTDVVEVYTVSGGASTGQWWTTRRLPSPKSAFSTVLVGDGDFCYALGGTGTAKLTCTVVYDSLYNLLQNTVPYKLSLSWRKLPDTYPLFCPSLVEVDGKLIAMGGSIYADLRHGTRYISTYDYFNMKWVECKSAQLPVPVFRPGVVKLSNSKVMIVGGEMASQKFSASVFVGNFSYAEL